MLGLSHVAIILSGIVAFALLSRRIEASPLTLPMVFTAFGWAIGQGGARLVPMDAEHEIIHAVAEITLILVLFADASRIDLRKLAGNYRLAARMLLIGMPLTILLGTLLARWVSPEVPWASALLVAAILTPTDAALGQAVVTSPKVPSRLRQALNVESGLNDGLAVPVVMVAALLAVQAGGVTTDGAPGSHAAHFPANLYVFTALQIVLGPIAGVGVGYLLARLLDLAIDRRLVTDVFQGIAFLCGAFLAFVGAELIGGNGLIAAFVGGLVFGNTLQHSSDFIDEFMEGEGQLLTIVTFLVFGAVLVPLGIEHATWKTLTLAVLFLSLVRMLPVWLALAGSDTTTRERLFLGWFGPRGLASILFALLVVERFPIPGAEEILSCVVLTVLLSIVLHGMSANPLSARLWRRDRSPQPEGTTLDGR